MAADRSARADAGRSGPRLLPGRSRGAPARPRGAPAAGRRARQRHGPRDQRPLLEHGRALRLDVARLADGLVAAGPAGATLAVSATGEALRQWVAILCVEEADGELINLAEGVVEAPAAAPVTVELGDICVELEQGARLALVVAGGLARRFPPPATAAEQRVDGASLVLTVVSAAAGTGAAQHDVVLVDRELEPLRERGDGLLEPVVGELSDAPAAIADDVVMVLAARVRSLVARGAVSHVQAVHEAEAVEHLERAVDAGDSHPRLAGAQLVGDLLRGRAAVLPSQRSDDARARSTRPEALALERRVSVRAPALVVGVLTP